MCSGQSMRFVTFLNSLAHSRSTIIIATTLQAYITIAEMEDIFKKVKELPPEDGTNKINVCVPVCMSIYRRQLLLLLCIHLFNSTA